MWEQSNYSVLSLAAVNREKQKPQNLLLSVMKLVGTPQVPQCICFMYRKHGGLEDYHFRSPVSSPWNEI